jgi:hypothetical protein
MNYSLVQQQAVRSSTSRAVFRRICKQLEAGIGLPFERAIVYTGKDRRGRGCDKHGEGGIEK